MHVMDIYLISEAYANSGDPDQTALKGIKGAVWSESPLFAIPSSAFGHLLA